jgi:RsiW-degrading membrane proteinase PrsW (M82 family)
MTCLLGTTLSILVTLIPSLIAIAILWWLDRYEKEPLWLLTIIFLWGAVPTILMSLVSQVILDLPLAALLGPSILYQATNVSIIAPLTEETFKALIILAVFLFYRSEFDGVMDGIFYGALVGFGFSVVEDVFYFMGSLMEGSWAGWGMTVAMRVGLYNLNHSLFAACTGIGFGMARNAREIWKKVSWPILGWLAAMALHGIHNGGTVLAEATSGLSCVLGTFVDWLGVVAMLILIIVATRRESRWFAELEPEVAAGVVTAEEYRLASQPRMRFAQGWQILTRYGVVTWVRWTRYVQMVVDLAYKKHQKRAAGEGVGTDRLIAELRQRIARARAQLPRIGG